MKILRIQTEHLIFFLNHKPKALYNLFMLVWLYIILHNDKMINCEFFWYKNCDSFYVIYIYIYILGVLSSSTVTTWYCFLASSNNKRINISNLQIYVIFIKFYLDLKRLSLYFNKISKFRINIIIGENSTAISMNTLSAITY
jgi:hypothetical protein